MDQDKRIAAKRLLQKMAKQVDLAREAVLDETIQPSGRLTATPTRVLLTGVTGYLGAFLLFELLERTDAEVICLVRSDDGGDVASVNSRVQKTLEGYGLWDQARAGRIRAVRGDLAKPLFGMEEASFNALAQEIDAIYHSGAVVNLLYPYGLHKLANVGGTVDILRLASRGRGAPIHFVSTAGIFSAPELGGRLLREDEPLTATQGIPTGYMQSKWVADRLVAIARERGFATTVSRPVFVGWRTTTGVFNDKDFVCGMLDGCLDMGRAPEMDMLVDCIPVDFVSKAIVHISLQKSSIGKAFHLCNPKPSQWNALVEMCRSLGHKVRSEPYPLWRRRLDNGPETLFYKRFSNLLPESVPDGSDVLAESFKEGAFPRLDWSNTAAALAGTGITCAPLDADALRAHVEHRKRATASAVVAQAAL